MSGELSVFITLPTSSGGYTYLTGVPSARAGTAPSGGAATVSRRIGAIEGTSGRPATPSSGRPSA